MHLRGEHCGLAREPVNATTGHGHHPHRLRPWWRATDQRRVLALANVGDSRAYVYSDATLVQVTADHSLAEERMRHGEMTEAEAAVTPSATS